jgi:hypothetical protein
MATEAAWLKANRIMQKKKATVCLDNQPALSWKNLRFPIANEAMKQRSTISPQKPGRSVYSDSQKLCRLQSQWSKRNKAAVHPSSEGD